MPYEPLNLVSSSDWAKVKYANTIKDNFDAIVGGKNLLESINSLYGRLNTVANDLSLLEKELKNFTNTSQIDFTNKINELQNTYNTFKADVDNKLSESDDKLISLENDTGRKENLNEYFNDPNTGEKRNLPLSINKLLEDIGYVSQLLTVSKNVVGAINEHDTEIGNISDLTTNNKSDIVKAINEHDAEIGDINNIENQINAGDIVSSINKINNLMGELSSLTTLSKGAIINAINELDKEIGEIADLTTDNKIDIIQAINSLKNNVMSINGVIGDITTIEDQIKNPVDIPTVVGSLNKISEIIGDFNSLSTTVKDSIISSLNNIEKQIKSNLNIIVEIYPDT